MNESDSRLYASGVLTKLASLYKVVTVLFLSAFQAFEQVSSFSFAFVLIKGSTDAFSQKPLINN